MYESLASFNAYLPRMIHIDPLVRVYLHDNFLTAIRIGHQFSDLESSKLISRIEHYDTLVEAGAIESELSVFRLPRTDVVNLTLDHTRSMHLPASPASIRIETSSGDVATLLLPPKADVSETAEVLRAFHPTLVIHGTPRIDKTTPQSPRTIFRLYLVLGSIFAACSVGFLWYALQQVAHLPILIAVPPNVWGTVHCFRRAYSKWQSMGGYEQGG